MKLRFLGANGNVTGSQHFVEYGDFRFIVDCGMVQEREYLGRNWNVNPENPSTIDAIFLTHAHLDHCGLIPKLVKDGFRG
ncbi:MAG: MBL fold metallo-hydrolase, partial [Planctomycetia bacterium]|nr:MBL fold metallo-hydrolase [Planctomycetia bacterium]